MANTKLLNWDTTRNYLLLNKYRYDESAILLFEGGSRSGKTFDIIFYFITKCLENMHKGLRINWCRATQIGAKSTLLPDFLKIATMLGFKLGKEYEYTTLHKNFGCATITLFGNYIRLIGMNGAGDIEKIHGLMADEAWVNEAVNVKKAAMDQLRNRLEGKLICDYNPSELESYIYDWKLLPQTHWIRTTILDNKHAHANSVRQILGYEPTPENIANKTADELMWNIYGLGLQAASEAIIFRDWELFDEKYLDENEKPKFSSAEHYSWGLDFGYSIDQCGVVYCKIDVKKKQVFVWEKLYARGYKNNDIAKHLKEIGIGGAPIVCDCSEPKSIDELRMYGVNAFPADKSKGIDFSIQKLKQFRIFVESKSYNFQKEIIAYRYKTDINGNVIIGEIDKGCKDHLIDPLRYIFSTYFKDL